MAVDASGNVWVADTYNNRIQKFGKDGNFLLSSGSLGAHGGGFKAPWGVAVDAAGNVYVADTNNHRIKKHNSSGTFVRTWGWGVQDGTAEFQTCTFGPLCLIGLPGSGDGQLGGPAGVAVDSFGNVYVADNLNERIQKFDGDGTYLAQWGTWGDGDGELNRPSDVAVGVSGSVYVVDNLNHRIQMFDRNHTFLTKWGTQGSGDGEFESPRGVAVDGRGDIYVADTSNHRIQVFRHLRLDFFMGEPERSRDH